MLIFEIATTNTPLPEKSLAPVLIDPPNKYVAYATQVMLSSVKQKLFHRNYLEQCLHCSVIAWSSNLWNRQSTFSNFYLKKKRCKHAGVTHLSGRNKATSASDRRPSALWVLSSAGKLIRSDIYTGPRSRIVPQTFSSFVFYPLSLSFCHSAWLFTKRSLGEKKSRLHIMIRHAPYC